jgi:hypothetical protein
MARMRDRESVRDIGGKESAGEIELQIDKDETPE